MPRTSQPLHRLLAARAVGSGSYNHDSAALFNLSRRPFPLWMIHVWWFNVI